MRAANSQDGDLPEELSDVDGGDEDFTLAEEEAEENPDDLLNFPDLMEEAPETGNEEDEQP
jgi:hypothetical protein